MRVLIAALMVLAGSGAARADVWLDGAWGEGMILQTGVKAPLHGTAKAGEKVSVTFRGKTIEAEADKSGKWRIEVEPGEPGGPFPMTLKGANTIELKNVSVVEMSLGQVLGDGMVLQRGGKAPVFGTAAPGTKVSVAFRGKSWDAVAGADGAWRVDVEPGEAGGPFPMSVRGKAAIELKAVSVGEVWVCSGQSNMRWGVSYTKDAGSLKLDPPNELLRLQKFPEGSYAPDHPQLRFGGWTAADKKSVMAFSGTGYYFGAALQEKLKVPVGLIHAAFDASGIREWMPELTPDQKDLYMGGGPAAGGHYARQVRAIQPYAIRGVIWYQGEANASKDIFKIGYARPLAALIGGWRRDWGQGDFPFLIVQLARIGFGPEQVHNGKLPSAEQREIVGDWSRVRDEQRRALAMVPGTGLAVSYDLTTGMLHPPEKKPIGERLAVLARAQVYGEKVEGSGPLVESAKVEGNEVVLTFSHAEGLAARDGEPRQFELRVQGQEKFAPAKARIDGTRVRLEAVGLAGPLDVRYACREWPDGNLYNAAGLPASPFELNGVK
ncbi:MAG TPA: sialate O-acetylesterase [Planctomycetota bacterium]|nr:sialate O-acetylesterase [Planctomycetota bacterium]